MLVKLIAAWISVIASSGIAMAQAQLSPAQTKQLACISDRLIAEKVDASIARTYASGDQSGQEYEANLIAMDTAMIACQQQYKWSDNRTNLAAQVAMFQIVLDNFSLALRGSKGITDASFDQIGTVLTAMPAADRDTLMDGGWREDAAAMKRISDSLIAAGLSSDPTILAYAFLVMEAKLIVTYSTMDWADLPG